MHKRRISLLFLIVLVLILSACQWSWWQQQWQSGDAGRTPEVIPVLTMAAYASTQYAGTPWVK